MIYKETPEFLRDLKKLSKRFRTLEDDLEVAKKNAVELYHEKGVDNQSVFLISGFSSNKVQVIKLKKFACRALKGRGVHSGVRVVYAFFPKTKTIEFIEMYFKADQENENRKRIQGYLSKLKM